MLVFILLFVGVLVAVGGGRMGDTQGWLICAAGLLLAFAAFDTMFGITHIHWPFLH